MTAFQLDVLAELLPDLGGRTGRLDRGDSIRAAADSDSHDAILLVSFHQIYRPRLPTARPAGIIDMSMTGRTPGKDF